MDIKYDEKVIPSDEMVKGKYEFFEKIQKSMGIKPKSISNNAQKDSSEEQEQSEKSDTKLNNMEEKE